MTNCNADRKWVWFTQTAARDRCFCCQRARFPKPRSSPSSPITLLALASFYNLARYTRMCSFSSRDCFRPSFRQDNSSAGFLCYETQQFTSPWELLVLIYSFCNFLLLGHRRREERRTEVFVSGTEQQRNPVDFFASFSRQNREWRHEQSTGTRGGSWSRGCYSGKWRPPVPRDAILG